MTLLVAVQKRLLGLSDRTKSIGKFVVTSIASRAVSTCCQLIQVPLAVHALGVEAFGFWMTLTSINMVICFSDFGVGLGAQNKMSEAFEQGDRKRARAIWDNALGMILIIWAVLSLLTFLIGHSLDFIALFNLKDLQIQSEARSAAICAILLYCLNMPIGFSQILAYSRQKAWLQNVVQTIGSIGSLVGVFFATQMHGGLVSIIVAAQVPLLAANAFLLFYQLRELGWLDIMRMRYHPAIMRDLVKLGSGFGIQQVYYMMMLAAPSILISTVLGAAAVTPYNLGQRFFNLFTIGQNALMQPLWPAYSNAKARGDWAWIKRMLRLSSLLVLLCTILPMALGTFFAQDIIRYWVGASSPPPSQALLWALFLWNALMFIEQPFGFLLSGISEIRRLTFYTIISGIISPPLMYFMLYHYGSVGLFLAMAIAFLPILIFGAILEAIRVFRSLANKQEVQDVPMVEALVTSSQDA